VTPPTLAPPRSSRGAGTSKASVPRLALTRTEAAASLGVSEDYFDQHVAPTLPMCRLGRRCLVPVAALEKWLAQNATRALA
jgi:excisionase family DNA binding protein